VKEGRNRTTQKNNAKEQRSKKEKRSTVSPDDALAACVTTGTRRRGRYLLVIN
jgi:hypothetical protein